MAQVVVEYHLPSEMMQPFWEPELWTDREPLPMKAPEVDVGMEVPVVVVTVVVVEVVGSDVAVVEVAVEVAVAVALLVFGR